MIKKIYLAGGMQNLSLLEQKRWREKIKKDIREKYNYQIEIVDPTNYYNFERCCYDNDQEVKKWDLHEVKTSDLIIVYFNDVYSIGTAQELQCAEDNDIIVLGIYETNNDKLINGHITKPLHPWLKCSCNKIFDNIDSCIDYLNEFYLDDRRYK